MKIEINSLIKTSFKTGTLVDQIPEHSLEPLQLRVLLEMKLQIKKGVTPSLESVTRSLMGSIQQVDKKPLQALIKAIAKSSRLDRPSQQLQLHGCRMRAQRKLVQLLSQLEETEIKEAEGIWKELDHLRSQDMETRPEPISARDWSKIERIESDEIQLMIDWFKDNGVTIKKKVLYAFITMTNGGKTILKTWMAFELMRVGQNVLFLAQEEPYQDTIRRIHQQALDLSEKEYAEEIKDGYDYVGRKFTALSKEKGWGNIWVVEWPGITIEALKQEVQTLEEAEGITIDGLVIDYAKLVQSESKSAQEWERLGKIFTELKQLAMETNKWVFTSMQLNREATKKMLENGRMPNLADVAGAYDATHACNYVWAARLAYEENQALEGVRGTFTLSVQKQKYGDLKLGDSMQFQWTDDHTLNQRPEIQPGDVAIPSWE